jgi:energy-converting hydrogenase Eha subunit F
METKPQVLFEYGILLLALIFTFSILQFPSLQQQQYYQRATAQQQQHTMKQPQLQYSIIMPI